VALSSFSAARATSDDMRNLHRTVLPRTQWASSLDPNSALSEPGAAQAMGQSWERVRAPGSTTIIRSLIRSDLEHRIPPSFDELGLMGGQAALLPADDLPALERALRRFLAGVRELGPRVDMNLDESGLWTCILAVMAVAVACEIVRREQRNSRDVHSRLSTRLPGASLDDVFRGMR
jgi:hypothetical protein